ncbi:MAG: FAD-dependent oxidoreductase [Chloroflexi bacterium]|nr:FAD-dependent oxidoreductase [Chloroflexota bacterium]
MKRVVIVGGGFAGCAAAITVAKAGLEAVLIERRNALSGLGAWTGHLVTWVPRQETKLLGGGGAELVATLESLTLHAGPALGVPDHILAFDATQTDARMERLVRQWGVQVILRRRAVDVVRKGDRVEAVILNDGTRVEGDAFVDTTGKGGGMEVCEKYGQGCVVCVVQCPMWGDRVSISERAEVADVSTGREASYLGAMLLAMESLSLEVQKRIIEGVGGYSYHPLPEEMVGMDVTRYWRRPEQPPTTTLYRSHIEFLHMPFAKIYRPNIPTDVLHQIPGFENAWHINPMAGGDGQAVQLDSIAPHDTTMRVTGLSNMFCGGVRAGRYRGFLEGVCAADLAGYNACREAQGLPIKSLPETTVIGLFFARINQGHMYCDWPPGLAASAECDIYRERGLATTDMTKIRQRMEEAELVGMYGRKLVS